MRRFLKHLAGAFLIGTLLYIVFQVIYYFNGRFDSGIDLVLLGKGYWENMIFSIIIYMVNAYWFQYLLIHYKQDLFTSKIFALGVAGNVGLSIIGVFVSRLILFVGINGKDFSAFLAEEQVGDYSISMLIAVIIALIFYAIWYYKHRQESKVKEQKIIAGTASAKFDALKNQLDPHFLFNSLNVLTSLIEEDPHQAQKFTTSLSKVYRYVLEQKNKDLVSVDEELQFAKTYVRLLKMRFEDSIIFDIPDVSADPEAKIVPLSLQLLLENAVKHNVVTSDRPLHIKVFEKDNTLVVSNNLQEKQVVKKSSGVGLQNIRQRYGLLTDRRVSIDKTASDFKVHIPILTKQVSTLETQKAYIDDKLYKKAKERVEKLKGFYGNLLAYCIVIPFLALLNYQTTSFPWVIFPIFGWGIGVAAHGMEAFGYNPLWGKSWEERRIKKYMEDDNF